jgi:signal transduction histidine kinase
MWGLRGKLITAMLLVGAVPLIIGMGMALLQGTRELHEMAGTNFRSLAAEAARTMDLVLSDELTRMARMTTSPLVVDALTKRQRQILENEEQGVNASDQETQERWSAGDPAVVNAVTTGSVADFLKQQVARPEGDTGPIMPGATRAATRALFLTDAKGVLVASTAAQVAFVHRDQSWWAAAYDKGVGQPHIGNVSFDPALGVYAFHISLPVMDRIRYRAIGVLHRVFDAREYLAPALFPIRFGKTGHVMLLDSQGIVMACPILPTGIQLSDPSLIPLVTGGHAGWLKAGSDGHGGNATSIIGYAPLPGTSRLTKLSTETTWHTFVWQASEELSAPTHHFLVWLVGFGAVAMGLLGVLGYVASGRIVTPVRRLKQAASLIAKGQLKEPIRVKTGDELEQLADEMNRMNEQLEQSFSGLTDAVERKSREVRTLQVLNQQILESVPHPILLLNERGQAEYLNRAAQHAFGATEPLDGPRALQDVLGSDASARHRLEVELGMRQNGGVDHETGHREELRDPLTASVNDPGGTSEVQIRERVYQYQWFRIGTPTTQPQRLGIIFRDVTEERRLHEQVIQAEKASGLSVLTSGIGHELNNPLFGIIGLSEAIADESDPAVMKEHARDVVVQAKRIAAVIQDLTGTALRSSESPPPVECNEVVREVLGRFQTIDAAAEVDIRQDLQPLPLVNGGVAEIRQVLMNLLLNAVQAMKGRGVLEVKTEASNGEVLVSVHDSGGGIPRAHLPKVFDPFFTTKAQGEGRGLGLTVARRIIESRGGQIRIVSREGQGTTVLIALPVLASPTMRGNG